MASTAIDDALRLLQRVLPMQRRLVHAGDVVCQAGEHFERLRIGLAAAGHLRQGVQYIQKRRVHGADVAGTEVAQKTIDGRERIRHVFAAAEVREAQAFARVEVEETQCSGLEDRRARRSSRSAERQSRRGEEDAATGESCHVVMRAGRPAVTQATVERELPIPSPAAGLPGR